LCGEPLVSPLSCGADDEFAKAVATLPAIRARGFFVLARWRRLPTVSPKPPMNTVTATMEPAQRAARVFFPGGSLNAGGLKSKFLSFVEGVKRFLQHLD